MGISNETAQEESLVRKWTGSCIEGIKGGLSMQTVSNVYNSMKLSKETVADTQGMIYHSAQEESLVRKWTGSCIEGIKGGLSMQTVSNVYNSMKLSKETVADTQGMIYHSAQEESLVRKWTGSCIEGIKGGLSMQTVSNVYNSMKLSKETVADTQGMIYHSAQEESSARKQTGRIIEGIKGGSCMQTRFKVLNSKKLSKETVAGIQDMTMGRIRNGLRSGKAIIRFDTGRNTGTNPHINIDPRGYPSRKNPHIAVPEVIVNSAGVLNSILYYAGIALTITSVTIETWRIGSAIRDDISVNQHADEIIQELEVSRKKLKKTFEDENNLEKILKNTKRAKKAPVKTIKTVASAAGGWGGAFAAGGGGAWAGASTGATIGSLFGPAGVAVFTPIGAVAGAIGLGIAGGVAGSSLGESVAEAGLTLLDD